MRYAIRVAIAALTALVLAVGASACGSSDNSSSKSSSTTTTASKTITANSANAKTTVVVGSKNFTEEYILGEIYAQALQAAGYKVKKQLNLGSEQIAFKALKTGQVDAYPEYTGTALTSFFNVKIDKVPKDDQAAYELAKTDFAKDKLTALAPTPFTDSQAIGSTTAKAKQLGIKTISDLVPKAPKLTMAGSPECRQRPDCLLGLEKTYGIKFKKFKPVDIATRYEVLDKGQADIVEVFTTDGQVATGKYTVFEDDKKLFPPYNATFVVRDSVLAKAGPDLQKAVELVQGGMTTKVMQELNSRVDLDKQTPKAVAASYLKESGYIK